MVDELRIGSLPWERVTHTAQPIARSVSFSGGQIVLPNIQVRPLPSAPDDLVIPAMHLESDEGGNVLAVPNCRQGHRRAVSGGREGSFYLVRDGRLIGKGTREGQEFPVCDAASK